MCAPLRPVCMHAGLPSERRGKHIITTHTMASYHHYLLLAGCVYLVVQGMEEGEKEVAKPVAAAKPAAPAAPAAKPAAKKIDLTDE